MKGAERDVERERGHEPSGLLWFAMHSESHKLCCFCRQGKGWDDVVKVGLISGVPWSKGERSECGRHGCGHKISVKDQREWTAPAVSSLSFQDTSPAHSSSGLRAWKDVLGSEGMQSPAPNSLQPEAPWVCIPLRSRLKGKSKTNKQTKPLRFCLFVFSRHRVFLCSPDSWNLLRDSPTSTS